MSTFQENPCLACTENQRCCSRLSGLRLSEEEFRKYFRNHSDRLSVVKDNKVFIVTSQDNGPCPHWDLSGCMIYNDRPIDCRVYPYEITQVVKQRKVIQIKFRESPACSQREHLLMPIEEAEELMKVFGQSAYGSGKQVVTKYIQEEKRPSVIFGLFALLKARLLKFLKRSGIQG
jgi:Fe-S-cluster containining protein